MKKPEITILMPVTKAATFVESAVDSILSQHFDCWELLLIEIGSVDNTIEKLGKYQDNRISFRCASSRSEAMRVGIMESSCNYIALMAPEYRMLPDRLGIQYATMETEKSIALCSSGCAFVKGIVKTGEQYLKEKGRIPYPLLSFLDDCPFIEASVMLRKDFLMREGMMSDKRDHDGDILSLWIEMAKRGAVFYVDPRCLISLEHDRESVVEDIHATSSVKSIRTELLEYLLESINSPALDDLYRALCSCSKTGLVDSGSITTRMRNILWTNKHKLYKTKFV